MNKLTFFVFIISIFMFSGCVNNSSIIPVYDNNTKELTILNKTFSNAKEIKVNNEISEEIKSYRLENRNCKDLVYISIYSEFDDVDLIKANFIMKKDTSCIITKSSNIKFIQCNKDRNKLYFVTNTIHKPDYEQIEILSLDSKCYYYLMNYYLSENMFETYKLK